MRNLSRIVFCLFVLCILPAGLPRGDAAPQSPESQSSAPDARSKPDEEMVLINANGVEIADLLQVFSAKLGIRFLYDEAVTTGKKVYLLSEIAVPRSELFSVLETILAYYDLAMVPSGGESSRIFQIMPVGNALRKKTPVYLFSRLEDLPKGNEMVTVIFPLRNAQSTIVVNALRPLLGDPMGGIDASGANIVIVVDRADNVRRFAEMIQAIDAKGAGAESAVLKLKHARAEVIAEKIVTLLSGPVQQAGGVMMGAPARAQVISDYRTNTIIITGSRADIDMAATVVRELDVPGEIQRELRFYLLENTSADEVAYSLGEMFDANVSASFSGAGQGLKPDEEGGIEGRVQVNERTSSKLTKPAEGVSQSVLDEIPMIIPEASLNRIIVIAPLRVHEEIEKAIRMLDIRKAQVLIEVAIVEITAEKGFNLATELASIDKDGEATFGFGSTHFGVSKSTDTDGDGVYDLRVPVAGLGGLLAGLSRKGQIPVLIHALSTKTDINVVSTPLLLVNDNEEAKFESTREEPTTEVISGETTDRISFKEFVEAGIKVKIVPAISEGGKYLRLYIEQDVDSFLGKSTNTGVPPPRQRNHLTTTVTVPNDRTVIIGGLAINSDNKSESGVPVLSKIPLFGLLFRGREDTSSQTRLYLFVRPEILSDADFGDLQKATEKRQKDMENLTGQKKEQENGGPPDAGPAAPQPPAPSQEQQ